MKKLFVLVAAAVFIAGTAMAKDELQSIDIDSEKGQTTIAKDAITIKADGTDIWGSSDSFRFVYMKASGNMEIVARINSLEESDEWAKAGVMIRGDLEAGSVHAMIVATPQHGLAFQNRPTVNAESNHVEVGAYKFPVYLKIKNKGSIVTAFSSIDGKNWVEAGKADIDMEVKGFYIGLAVTSHSDGGMTTAEFSGVQVNAVK